MLLLVCVACGSGRKTIREPEQATPEEAAPLRGPTEPLRLKVVTFNVQDLFVAKRRAERMRAIGRVLGPHRLDVICLQEAFTAGHRRKFLHALNESAGVAYEGIYFPSGAMGSGLYVVSRHPMTRAVFWRYTKNGAWYQFKHGDWYAGKGVAAVRIEVGGGQLDLLNTHAIANYNDAPYSEDRAVQLEELRTFLEAEALVPAPALVLGDLNCLPRHAEYKALVRAPLEDLIEAIAPDLNGRIDHVLVRTDPRYAVEPLELRKLFEGAGDDGKPLRLSDHPGYLLRLSIRPAGGAR